MRIEHFNEETKGHFKAIENNVEAGIITYSRAGTQMIILDHTDVNNDFRGLGVGNKMVLAAVDFARQNNMKIIPLCPFVKSVFDKTEEIRDVLA